MQKGQSGVELMVVVGIVLVLTSIVLFSISERNISVERARQQLAAQKEVEKLASAIDSASIGGKGFETNVTVSRTAATQNATSFSVDGRGRKVEMRWLGPRNESLAVSVRISTSNVKSAT
ncbi:MAG: hypothetical protein HY366_02810, partial [Candidatus Aenigmarchaeota archaeon]|nr:hypothetical protein [Candidatus Aenigmarchaeota archaeon]